MALTLNIPGSIHFSGSPVIASVTVPNSLFSQDISGVSMMRCTLRISRKNSSVFREYRWDIPASGGTFVQDISSALRALIRDYSLTEVMASLEKVGSTGLPALNYEAVAYVTYLKDGDEYGGISSGGNLQSNQITAYAVHGSLTEEERDELGSQEAVGTANRTLTRKPKQQELKPKGMPYPTSTLNVSSKRVITVYTTIGESEENGANFAGEKKVFLFRNGLGAPEVVCALCLPRKIQPVKSASYGVVGAPSFVPNVSRRVVAKRLAAKWKMSSGPVNEEWAEWWTTEFLCAKEWFMQEGDRWIPVTITPGAEEVTLVDETKATVLHVDFTVEDARK